MRYEIMVDEWYEVREKLPPSGRVVLCVVTYECAVIYAVLKWNGMYWIDGNTNLRTPMTKKGKVLSWRMFERYVDRSLV